MKVQSNHHQMKHPERSRIQAEWQILEKRSHNFQPPKPRFKHLSFVYNNVLYIYGGAFINNGQNNEDPLDLHMFHLSKHQLRWEKTRLKCYSKELQLFSGHCGAIKDKYLFMFGGVNPELKCNNHLWKLNIQTLELQLIQTSGSIPQPRQSAHIFTLSKNWLLLYGGINTNSIQIYNSFHFYNISSKMWSECQGTSEYQVYPRYDPALCHFNDKIYLFGGSYRNIENREKHLDDLYQVSVTIPPFLGNGLVKIRRLQTNISPPGRSGHSLVGFGENYLFLIGGETSSPTTKEVIRTENFNLADDCWVFNIMTGTWAKLALQTNNAFKYTTQSSINCHHNDSMILFGGLHSYSESINDVIELSISEKELSKFKDDKKICQNCEIKQRFDMRPTHFPAQFIEDIADNIDFPFAAFGLLADNAMNFNSTFFNISYKQGTKDIPKFIRIVDNAKLPWDQEELLQSMSKFNTQSVQFPAGADKKTRLVVYRERLIRQYGTYMKIASLRLGSGFLHVSHSENKQVLRVFLFQKEEKQGQQFYVLKYYIAKQDSKELLNKQMQPIREQINKKYGPFIKQALSLQPYKNILYILNAKVQEFKDREDIFQLKANEKYNDLINCSSSNFTTLQELGYNITDCVDVSLKAYLVSLYVKNQTMKISLSIKNVQPALISTQIYLERVDKLCKQKCVFEINNLVDYDFRIVELYYIFDMSKKLNFFSNGLLLYHRNRLITRYKYKLGELLQRKMYKAQGNYNFIRLFGFIELPDNIPLNVFKTTISYPIMMNKLNARIKFINKSFKNQIQRLASQSVKRIAPTKLSNSEIKQDQQDNPEFCSKNEKEKRSQSRDKDDQISPKNYFEQKQERFQDHIEEKA